MDKTTLFTGQPVFNQLLSLIPKRILKEVIKKHQSDRYYKRFKTYDHLVTMLFTTFHGCKSLREVTTGMMACTTRLNHLGIIHTPRRSTIAEANTKRAEKLFDDLYHGLYSSFYPDSRMLTKLDKRLFIIDSSTISLFSEVMRGSGQIPLNSKRKGGVKVHVLTKADEDVPRFVCLTEAKENDNIFTPMISLPKNSIVTFDTIYYAFKPLIRWTNSGVTWVTRLHPKIACQVYEKKEVSAIESSTGIISDEKIIAGSKQRKDRIKARKILYKDPLSGKELVFFTNNTRMKASTIAGIYKRRWQIETLFKRLKQNYPLKYFLGDSENAIKIQIWCALITDLLIKIVKDKVKRKWAFSNISGMIRLHLMTYINLIKFLQNPEKALRNYLPQTQLQLSLFPT